MAIVKHGHLRFPDNNDKIRTGALSRTWHDLNQSFTNFALITQIGVKIFCSRICQLGIVLSLIKLIRWNVGLGDEGTSPSAKFKQM